MAKIKKGDQVVVLAGRDKGRRGPVTRVLAGGMLLVENINRVKRHQKGNPQKQLQSGIVEKDMPLPVAKVALWNPATKQADRVGFKQLASGKKVRVFKSNGEVIDA